MKPWGIRPVEVKMLLNPAFCGEIICEFSKEYGKTSEKSTPYSLCFLVLPVVLHKRMRESLVKNKKRTLHGWVQENPFIRAVFVGRAKKMVPITREAIILMVQNGVGEIDTSGQLIFSTKGKKRNVANTTPEVRCILEAAKNLGRMFARASSEATIFSVLGVRP